MSSPEKNPPAKKPFAVDPEVASHHLAVIGMAGRFPGAASVEELWQLLATGREGISFFTPGELDDPSVTSDELASGLYVPARGVLAEADRFDAAFFGYSAREAEILDPQQRVFLECAWQAMESAGYDPLAFPGLVGVYAGTGMSTYAAFHLLPNAELVRKVGAYQLMLGNEKDFLATTVSYRLDLRGPSLAVQTACSTSLVAVHLAALSLASFDCDLALAGGVSVQFPQQRGHRYEEGGILSPDGHCRAFDRDARGMVGGSGAGVVVLKRLAEAIADGDPIRAVIRGTAANNDGRDKVGYTAPSVAGQAEVIAAAHAVAGVTPQSLGYVEGHGTATPLGDPIEVEALKRVWAAAALEPEGGEPPAEVAPRSAASSASAANGGAEHRRREPAAGPGWGNRCALGSLKSNIGHLDAAAGVAGLIKTVLALENETIPPTLHFRQANPRLGLDDSPFFVNPALLAWPRREDGEPRRAAVSSFGIGGTNAHAVLEEAPLAEAADPGRPWSLVLLSARSEAALAHRRADLAAHLRDQPETSLADVAHTLAVGRHAFGHRLAVLGRNPGEIVAALAGDAPERCLAARTETRERPVAFLLPGQGTQSVGMARAVYAAEPVFRDALDRCAEELRPHLGLDLVRLLYPAAGEATAAAERLAETRFTQPAVFAVSFAMAELLASWGLRPVAMLGHSLGEYVAATLAGVLPLADALRLVAARGRLMQALPGGAMLAVPLSEAAVLPLLGEEWGDELDLAAVNAPELVTVAGPAAAIDALAERLARQGVLARRLRTSHAFHSRAMDALLEPFGAELARLDLAPPASRYLSNLTGTWVTPEQATDPAAWLRQLREPVRFADGLATLRRDLASEQPALVEVGPGRSLGSLVAQQKTGGSQLRAQQGPVLPLVATLPTQRPGDDKAEDGDAGDGADPDARGLAALQRSVAQLWLSGVEIDWQGFYAQERRRRLSLPTYPFERQRYFVEAAGGTGTGAEKFEQPFKFSPAPGADPAAIASPAAGAAHTRPELAVPFVAPAPGLEATLAAAWSELLGVAPIGRHDDFFELGGHSLAALRLAGELSEQLGQRVTVAMISEAPTVAQLAARLASAPPASAPAPTSPHGLVRLQAGDPVRLHASDTGRPFFAVHPIGGGVLAYRDLARRLGGPFHAFEAPSLDGGEPPAESVESLAERYLPALLEASPGGPYRLLGWSFGGLVAAELAARLAALGREVELLVLIDSWPADGLPLPSEEELDTLFHRDLGGGEIAPSMAEPLRRQFAAHARAAHAYRPRALGCPVLLVLADGHEDGGPDAAADLVRGQWAPYLAGPLRERRFPGHHYSLLVPPTVESVAAEIAAAIEWGASQGLASSTTQGDP